MTKTTTINWKGGSRRIELQCPGEMRRLHHLATTPTPITMDPESLAWMNTTMVLGTGLERETVESMAFANGLGLLSEVLSYWGELQEEDDGDSDKVADVKVEGLELDDQGTVDLEDMR